MHQLHSTRRKTRYSEHLFRTPKTFDVPNYKGRIKTDADNIVKFKNLVAETDDSQSKENQYIEDRII